MLYLSDQIFVTIPNAVGEINQYVDYTINATPPYWSNLPTKPTLFTGRAFIHKTGQQIYLNDILSSYGDNYSWMSYENVRKHNSSKTMNELMDLTVRDERKVFSTITTTIWGSPISKDISFFYRDKALSVPKNRNIYGMSWFRQTLQPQAFNVLYDRVEPTIIPRIPVLDVDDTDFFVGGLFAVNAAWRSYSDADGDGVFRVVIVDNNMNYVYPERDDYGIYDLTTPVTSVLIGGYIINGNSPGGFEGETHRGQYLAIAPAHRNDYGDLIPEDVSNPILLAQFDRCNADYYLIWCDRTGGYQCQPFHKKTTLIEDIATSTITNIYDEERPYLRSVTNKWTLNSDWLSYEEHKAYESIFTSPYTYLFDVKNNELTPVMCLDKSWTDRTSKNTNKPFNLKLTVTENRKQNILY